MTNHDDSTRVHVRFQGSEQSLTMQTVVEDLDGLVDLIGLHQENHSSGPVQTLAREIEGGFGGNSTISPIEVLRVWRQQIGNSTVLETISYNSPLDIVMWVGTPSVLMTLAARWSNLRVKYARDRATIEAERTKLMHEQTRRMREETKQLEERKKQIDAEIANLANEMIHRNMMDRVDAFQAAGGRLLSESEYAALREVSDSAATALGRIEEFDVEDLRRDQ